MVFAAELARLAGRLGGGRGDRHRAVLASLGLPTLPRRRLAATLLRRPCGVDKKTRGDRLRFVVLDGLGRGRRCLEGPDPRPLLRGGLRGGRAA